MRNATYTDEQIIEAGKSLQELGRGVNAFSLRRAIGGGNSSRLIQVWNEYVATQDAANTIPVADLPVEVAEGLNEIKTVLLEQLSALVVGLNDRAVRASERRVAEIVRSAGDQRTQAEQALSEASDAVDELEDQLEAANGQIVDLRNQLERVVGEKQALTVELAQVKERLASVEKAADNAGAAAAAREQDLSKQLLEQRNLEQMAREREAQAVGAQAALEKQHLEDAEVSVRLRLELRQAEQALSKISSSNETLSAQVEQLTTSVKEAQQARIDAQIEAKNALQKSAEAAGREQAALEQIKKLTDEVRQLAAKTAKPAAGKTPKPDKG